MHVKALLCAALCLLALPTLAQGLDVQVVRSPRAHVAAWLARDHSVPVVTLSFAFTGAGSAADPEGRAGLAHMASITMDEGAGEMDSRAFQAALAERAIELHFFSDRDAFGGTLRTLSDNRDEAFALLALALAEPRFDAEAVGRMRAAAAARLRSDAADPAWLAARLLNDQAFAGHPYAANSGGSLTSLAAIGPEELRAFSRGLSRDRLVVGAAGDITAQELGAALDRVFGGLPAVRPAGRAPLPCAGLQNLGQVFVHPVNGPQSAIAIAAPGLAPNTHRAAAWEVLNHILGGAGFGSRLMASVREERGLTYGIYTAPRHLARSDTLRLATATGNESAGKVLGLIRAGWASMAAAAPTDEELAMAKASLKGRAVLALTSTPAIARALVTWQRQGLPPDHLSHRAREIDAVTARDVQRLAESFLDPDRMVVAIVGRPDGLEGALDTDPVIVDTIAGIE